MSNKAGLVEQVVREALKVVRPDMGEVAGSAHLSRDFGLDSLQVMDMVMEIEDRLDISVPVETLADAQTLDQLCAGITRLLSDAA